jgi:hypothetical protein
MQSVKRYSPTLDWAGCYYECDQPDAVMYECKYGDYVALRDYEALQAKIDELMLEFTPDEMTPDQLRKYSEHQRPV